uniref:Craniofacial development protein 2 n=1 Tax=Cacopsylla melanoneura TaxID=428564 RepID=A0A8D8SJV6_9HEMI
MNNLVVMNTWFKMPPRRLYTWKSPMNKADKIIRNQIDFILVNQRFRNSCTSVKTYPGADINSDHNPLVGVFKIRLKKIKTKKKQHYDLRKLKDPVIEKEVCSKLNSLINTEETEDIGKNMKNLKKTIQNIKDELLKPDKTKKKPWMTTEILDLMEERRVNKGNHQEYKRLQVVIRRKIREAKENEKKEQCAQIEYYQNKHDDFNVHRKVREITGSYRKANTGKLEDDTGKLILTTEERKDTWKKYLETLFYDTRNEVSPEINEEMNGPQILEEEVQTAINQIKQGKAAGPDQIQAEFLKLLDETKIKWLTHNKIYESGTIPT